MKGEAHQDQSQPMIKRDERCALQQRLGKYQREPEILPQIFQRIGDGDPLGHPKGGDVKSKNAIADNPSTAKITPPRRIPFNHAPKRLSVIPAGVSKVCLTLLDQTSYKSP